MKRLLFFICTLLCANVLMAQTTFWIGDIQYEVTSTNPAEVEVNDANSSITTAIIPSTVSYGGITYTVTSIGNDAFWNCSSLTSIDIPNSVTSIGSYAFSGCNNLTSIDIPNSVTSIGESAFANCDGLTSVTIPNSVTSIGSYAFRDCEGLTSVTIPNSVTSIGESAFDWCTSLTSIDIPNSVTSIGDWAFWNCSSLTSVTIPNSVTSIGDGVFSDCISLTSVNIPNSVTSIAVVAFQHCISLTSVTIPNSVTSIDEGTFRDCYGLTSVTCLAETAPSLGASVFYDTPSTKVLNIPCESDYSAWESATTWASVERIGCEEEECVDVFTIGDLTYEKTSATEVSVKDCSETATEVIIPASVEQCGITYSVTSIGNNAFEGCSSLTSIDIPNGVTSIGNYAFWLCDNLTSIDIPNSVTSIGNSAFRNCSSLTSIDIPNSVTSIGDGAFNGCSNLTSIDIPNSITSIGTSTFSGCSNLTSITIPNSVTSIAGLVFSNCSSLTSITIPNSVTSIGMWAFSGCSGLDSVICLAETAPSLGSAAFSGSPSTKTLTVPFGSDYSSWEEASTWQKVYYLIQEGESKELASDFTITEVRKIKNEGVLRIKPTGQLINSTSENVSGIIEIETPTLPNDKWSFIGAPFNGYKLEAVKPGTNDISVSLFDYNTGNWSNDFATIEDTVGAGEGFFAWSFAEEPTTFTTDGEMQDYTLNNSVVTVTKSLKTHTDGGNWLALSNPYTFKLDVNSFLSEQSDIKGGVVYRFNGTTWDDVEEGVINMTEGFFVNYEDSGAHSVLFSKFHRYVGAKAKAKKEYITLNVKEGERVNKLRFAQNEKAKQGDDHYDANKLFSPIEITEPYFVTDGVALVKEEVKEFPYTANLNIRNYETKEITISIDNIPEGVNVYLIDNGYDIKMNGGVEYNTRITTGENADRFKVLFKKQHRLEQIKDNQITITNYNRHISVQSQHTDLTIEVYNQLGQKVYSTKDYNFTLTDQPAGSYMIKAFKARESETKKIVIE